MSELWAIGTALFMAAAPPSPAPPATLQGEAAPRASASPADGETVELADALAELDRQNLGMAQARSRASEAEALARQATAALVPSVVASGSYVRNSAEARVAIGDFLPLPPGAPRPEPIVIQPLDSYTASGAVRVPLVVPNAWYDVAAARSGARAAGASAEAVRAQIRAGFAQAAYAAAAGEEVVLASERAVESAAAHARSADRRATAGTAAPLDVLKARTEQVHRESDLARARADLARGRLALGILLGRSSPVRIAVPAVPPEDASQDARALASEAAARRPEIAAQEAQVAAAEAAVRSARARYAPQLSATASAFTSSAPNPTGEKNGWRATVDLTWPLFDGGLREGKARQARAQLETARAAQEAQRLQVVQEVSDGVRDVQVARERLRLAETQRQLAFDAAQSASRSFAAGIASSLDVIDANDRLYQADVGLADGRARLAQARIALDRALAR